MKIFLLCSFGLLTLVSLVHGAPVNQVTETDPELTAGYFEGDMILGAGLRNGLVNVTLRWPNNIVYYKFPPGLFDDAHRNHILRGMQIIEEVSCIRFEEAKPDQKAYVKITNEDGGCFSSVGWQNREQTYNLAPYALDDGCYRMGTIVHEFLHTLGFFHQQSASNRDEYVRIAEENILPNTINNFYKYESDYVDDFDEEYDYGSVMHYPAYAFTKNGEMTIIPLKENITAEIMGQRRGMSKSDIHKLNVMYKCPMGM